jgi:hypothetical protein
VIIEEGKLIRGFEGLDVGDRVRVEIIGMMQNEDSSTSPEQDESKRE